MLVRRNTNNDVTDSWTHQYSSCLVVETYVMSRQGDTSEYTLQPSLAWRKRSFNVGSLSVGLVVPKHFRNGEIAPSM